jgi:hypothetical protein
VTKQILSKKVLENQAKLAEKTSRESRKIVGKDKLGGHVKFTEKKLLEIK